MNRILIVALLSIASANSMAADAPARAARTRLVTTTRLVHIFSAREQGLAHSVSVRDRDELERVLSDDFEIRNGSSPDRPLPRSEWIDQIVANGAPEAAFSDFAVHDLGSHAVVSCVRSSGSAKTGAGVSRSFVVDVWARSGSDDWRLAIRYESDLGGAKGAPVDTPPTGRN